MADLGVAIISFDRPHYLRRLLASLAQCEEAGETEFHLWQDGAVNQFSGRRWAKDEDIAASVHAFERARGLPKRWAHVQRQNVGVAINQFEAVEWMAERYCYILAIEDDVVVSPYWLRLCRVLIEQLGRNTEGHREPGWGEVFGFSLGFKRDCGKADVPQHLGEIRYGTPHWWAECFSAENWRRIRPHFLEYYELVRERDYADTPHAEITALWRRKGWGQMATSQDGGKDMAVHAAGLRRAVTVVNRGMSIGRKGIHFTPARFAALGYEDQTPYVFKSDATRERFEWL